MGLIIKNNVIYNGAESEPIIYSEEEREIGIWTDGKPLYQKTIVQHSTDATGTFINVDISALNIDNCVSIKGICDRIVPNVGVLIYEFNSFENSTYNTYIAYSKFNNIIQYKIQFDSGGGESTSFQIFTLQYTKTTDQPGSGTWTPSGVKTIHYSENEQVVGTWTDESTLYEKSYTIPQTSSGYTRFNFTGLNINEVINVYTHEGIAFAPSTSEVPHGSAPLSGYTQSSAGELGFVGYVTHDASTGVYQLHYRVGSYLSGGTARVTVRYNKITS